jgi:hypothetical protein
MSDWAYSQLRQGLSNSLSRVNFHEMTKVEALEREIESPSPEELAELRVWFAEREAESWDREFERDAASGKLDNLFATSLAEHRAGKSREI